MKNSPAIKPGDLLPSSPPTTVAVMGTAGGVATTTTAFHLAAGLAEYGFRVLTVDFTAFAGVTWLAGLEHLKQGILQVLEGELTIDEATVATNFGAHLLPSNRHHRSRVTKLPWTEMVAHYTPSNMFRDLEYDFVVLDCPSFHEREMADFALSTADYVILSTRARGTRDLKELEAIAEVEALGRLSCPRLSVLGILMTGVRRTRFHRNAIATLRREVDHQLFATEIHDYTRFQEAAASNQTIFAFDGKHGGATEYRRLVDEVLARLGRKTGPRTPHPAVPRDARSWTAAPTVQSSILVRRKQRVHLSVTRVL